MVHIKKKKSKKKVGFFISVLVHENMWFGRGAGVVNGSKGRRR